MNCIALSMGDAFPGRKQEMDMVRHDDEFMYLKFSSVSIGKEGCEKYTRCSIRLQQGPTTVRRRGNEVGVRKAFRFITRRLGQVGPQRLKPLTLAHSRHD